MSLDERINFAMIFFMIYSIFFKEAIGILCLFVNYSQLLQFGLSICISVDCQPTSNDFRHKNLAALLERLVFLITKM